ncbi:hypothetical protein Acr_22g0004410 [Actinidia rufa]|uniref:Uncharacterized protein n=1 Tax=Actinidia rufa TaxID=165716 RepID=A0A7J0GJR1_9ERIC|nr:hypothetical protein Acr_22g0004410 [Actinidia rufa]
MVPWVVDTEMTAAVVEAAMAAVVEAVSVSLIYHHRLPPGTSSLQATVLWLLVDEARERSTEVKSPMEAEKRPALQEGVEKMLTVEMSQTTED